MIDAKENAAFTDADFKERDADGDGKISQADLDVWLRTHVYGHKPGTGVPLPARAVSEVAAVDIRSKDHDGDGKISRREYLDAAAGFFRAMDHDGDGRLTHAEFGMPPGAPAPSR